MSEIYFVRHGQASLGARNYDQLSPLGWEQAVSYTHLTLPTSDLV